MIDQNLLLANLALSVVLPSLVALVTRRLSAPQVKTTVLLALSAIAGTLTQLTTNGGEFEFKTALASFGTTFLASVSAHYGLLKPAGVTGDAGLINQVVPGGLGNPVMPEPKTPTGDEAVVDPSTGEPVS